MAAIVWSDVSNAAPELATIVAGFQTDVLAYVNAALNVAIFDGEAGAQTRLARIMLAAHLGTLTRLGSGGQLTSSSAGGLARSFAAGMHPSIYALTSYGQAFRRLIPVVANGPQVT